MRVAVGVAVRVVRVAVGVAVGVAVAIAVGDKMQAGVTQPTSQDNSATRCPAAYITSHLNRSPHVLCRPLPKESHPYVPH